VGVEEEEDSSGKEKTGVGFVDSRGDGIWKYCTLVEP